ncbi:hypothetical protein ACQZ6C_10670 [Rhizobium rhizogenes]
MTWLYGKLQAYLAVAGAIIVAVAYAFLKGRAAGVQSSVSSINKETQQANAKFQKIDSQPPDFDGAISRLRERSKQ